MEDGRSLVLLKTLVDPATAEKVERMAAESEPRRNKSEMIRHLIRLGMRAYALGGQR